MTDFDSLIPKRAKDELRAAQIAAKPAKPRQQPASVTPDPVETNERVERIGLEHAHKVREAMILHGQRPHHTREQIWRDNGWWPPEWDGVEDPGADITESEAPLDAETVRKLRDEHDIEMPDWQPTTTRVSALPDFDGTTYNRALDHARLGAQFLRVARLMGNGLWWTLAEIAAETGDPEASVSARIRDLRKEKFGGFTVERDRLASGQHRYRLISVAVARPWD